MQDQWYADKKDLIKWGILLKLAEIFNAFRILQIMYYRPSEYGKINIDGKDHDMPPEVLHHFRNHRAVKKISSSVNVTVFDSIFNVNNRIGYEQKVLNLIQSFTMEKCLVFLDPDTGLAPNKPDDKHVLDREVNKIWHEMKKGDVLVFYQHKTNRNNKEWIEPKRDQIAKAINLSSKSIKMAKGYKQVNDVVFFFAEKT